MTTLTRRLTGLLATATLVGFAAGIPFALTLFGLGPVDILTHPIWSNLLAPDDGTMAWVGTAILAWAIWAVLWACLLVELVAAVRGVRAPDLRGLTVPQHAARTLLTWASLLFVAVPAATASLPIPAAHGASAGAVPSIAMSAPLRPDHAGVTVAAPDFTRVREAAPAMPPVASAPVPSAIAVHVPGTVSYQVKRGDSLWKIAQATLGDPLRYPEIAALNTDLLGGTPDFIAPPMTLLLPADATATPPPPTSPDDTYAVKAGDTLWQIADDELGDPARYPEIFEASTTLLQPGGERLTDPDLIKPGWTLDLTAGSVAGPGAGTTANQAPPAPPAEPPNLIPPDSATGTPTPPTAEASPEPSETPQPVDTAELRDRDADQAGEVDVFEEADTLAPSWLLPGLTGAGALLAGALLLTVRAYRRTQLRYRKPGQMLQPLPADLRAVESTTQKSGSPTAPRIETLDALLRELAATYPNPEHHPRVQLVELTESRATVHLAFVATMPAPWVGTGRTWSAPLTERAPAGAAPPYPLLVTVGRSPDGHVWLLNLEQVGSLAVTGDPDHAAAFGRYLAAELAVNPWSVLVRVHAVGFGHELATIDSWRLTHSFGDGPDALYAITQAVDSSTGILDFDPDEFHVLLTTAGRGDCADVRRIAATIATHPTRPGAAVVVIGGHAYDGDVEATTTIDGHVAIPALGLDLDGVGLTSQEASDCALLAATTEGAPCVAYPIDDTPGGGLVDVAGALRPDLVNDRPADPSQPAGATSLLPLPTGQYLDTAPTTAGDVDTLAPLVPAQTRVKVLAAYPGLDDDVAEWFKGRDCAQPRLAVLGPVTAHGRGDPLAAAKRRPFLTGLLGYLALHPGGVTSDEVKTVAGAENYRNRIGDLRKWMGTNPRTGQYYVPFAGRTRAATAHGQARYQIDDVLVDWHLFKALRARGEALGAADGIDDLELALSLVTGVPFSGRHPDTWRWLDETDRLDLIAPCAIVDVAHIVVLHNLTCGDVPRARRAVDIAILAAPDDETARLDLIEVLHAEGHTTLARTKLRTDIVNVTYDYRPPLDLPERTDKILLKTTHPNP